jgi:hypothetical protein
MSRNIWNHIAKETQIDTCIQRSHGVGNEKVQARLDAMETKQRRALETGDVSDV